jgi:hypothetical protein
MRAGFLFLSGLGLYGLIALGGACANTETTITEPTSIGPGTTSMSVDPPNFLGSVVCTNLPGGMGSFVATVTDVTDASNTFILPSSPPTSCSQSVYFQYVTPGHSYIAEVDGYVQTPDKLVPQCSALPPGPEVFCKEDGQCPTAYGCNGACRITTFDDANVACLEGCTGADAGADAGNPADVPGCVGKCSQFLPRSGAATVDAWVACMTTTCQVDAACLAANENCLTTEYAALQNDCQDSSLPLGTTEEGDGLVHGAVKACTCAYVQTEGSRQMYLNGEPDADAPLTPQWTTASPCGAGLMPPEAEYYVNVPIEPCNGGLVDSASTSSPTEIVLDPTTALGSLDCASTCDAGTCTVTAFDVLPAASNPSVLPASTGLACPGTPIVYQNDVLPAYTPYQFTLNAYEGGSTPTQTANCYASPIEGLQVDATCDPLAPIIQDAGTD